MNPNRRRLADALAFPKNEFKGRFAALKTLWRSSEAPNPAAEPESKKYDVTYLRKNQMWRVKSMILHI
jgi:hypothetical protein